MGGLLSGPLQWVHGGSFGGALLVEEIFQARNALFGGGEQVS
jgi:hypothetical protein